MSSHPETLEASLNAMAQSTGLPEGLWGKYQTVVLRQLHWEAICTKFPSTRYFGNVPEEDQVLIRELNHALRQSPAVPTELREIVQSGGVPHEPVRIEGKLNPIFTLPAETAEVHQLRADGVRELAEAIIWVRQSQSIYRNRKQ